MEEIVTTDLGMFGYREQEIAQDIFIAWRNHGLPEDFENEGVEIAFNTHSGYVFLTNSDYQVAIEEDGKLVSFYTTPHEGREGTLEDLLEEYEDMHPEDKEYIDELNNQQRR